jgi:elongation factor G
VWRQAERHGVPRLVFVNKLDRPGADVFACVDDVRARLGARPVLLTLPIGAGAELSGVVDLVSSSALLWSAEGDGSSFTRVPLSEALAAEAAPWRERLAYACAEHDEALAETLLAGREPGPEALRLALRRATIAGAIVPVLCGSAYKKRGVQPLLDAIVDYLPSPLDRPPVRGTDGRTRAPLETEPLAALVFKVMHTSAGVLSLLRVYSGVLEPKQEVACARTGARWRVGRVLRMFASRAEDVDGAGAGEIVAISGPALRTGDTVTDPEHAIALEAVVLPRPVVRLSLEAKTRDDHDRLGKALAKLVVEDPSLSMETDAETGELLLSGVGELQLETAIERLRDEHQVDVTAGRPRVAYQETITRTVEVEHLHKKQTGGPGQWAQLELRLSPAERGAGLVFEDRTVGGVLPATLMPAIRAGVEEAMSVGPVEGHPVTDVRVEVLDGATHVRDSSPLAFKNAAREAFEDAVRRAAPVLLEPIMRVEVRVPTESLGRTLQDLQTRRGRVESTALAADRRVVTADVPLAELFGYAAALRSLTQGRGALAMTFHERRPVR